MKNMITAKSAKKSMAKKLQQYLISEFSKENQYTKIVDDCLSFYKDANNWNETKSEITEI